MKTFQFQPIFDKSKANWDKLSQLTQFKAFTPTLTGFTGTSPEITSSYYLLYGPLVFLFLHFKSTGTFGWNASATIDVPIEPLVPTDGTFPQNLGPIIDLSDNSALTEYPIISSGPANTGRITLVTSQSGLSEIKLSSYYIRN